MRIIRSYASNFKSFKFESVMNKQYIKPLLWALKLQWQTSPAYIIWTVLRDLFNGLRPLFLAYAVAQLIDGIGRIALQSEDVANVRIYEWVLLIFGLELVNQIIIVIDRVAAARFEDRMHLKVVEMLILHIYNLNQQQLDDEDFSTKLGRAHESLYGVWRITAQFSIFVSSLIGLAGAFVIVIKYSPWIGLIFIASLIPVIIVNTKVNHLRNQASKESIPDGRISSRLRWTLLEPREMAEVRLMNALKKLVSSWRKHAKSSDEIIYSSNRRLAKFELITGIIQPFVELGASFHYINLVIRGDLRFDDFIFLRAILSQVSRNVENVTRSASRLHEFSIAFQNFNEIYQEKPAIPDGKLAVKSPLTIEFHHVDFAYKSDEEPVLRDICLKIVPGEKLALVGKNGAGKTTLIKLMLRQYLPTKGKITVNGVDIKDLSSEDYYRAVSNLSQEFLLFNYLVVRDNLLIGIEDKLSDEEIYRIAGLTEADKLIKALPKQLDTRLSPSFEDGTDFSGGERQRLAIARTLLRNAGLLILDEPTSAIDAKAEYEIFNNIYKTHGDKTILIVSHRFSTVRKADKIVVLDQGRITEQGSHEELLQKDGLYREMFEIQAEGYK